MFKSTDGGTTWNQITEGLPPLLQANLAIAPSNTKVLYATVAPAQGNAGASFSARCQWSPPSMDL